VNPGWRLRRWLQQPRHTCALREAGFEIVRLETMYLPGTPRIAGYNYWGEAIPRSSNRARTC
jgi:hypothetical protein